MPSDRLYLRPDIQVEPLFDSWYVWPHLIPPATAARNVSERHLKIMDSYIAYPQMHAEAVQNPDMLGGPFIDFGGQKVEEVAVLREQTIKRRASLLTLSAALAELDRMLEGATGQSLEPLYCGVPAALRGLVELVYDLRHRASYRLIEPLLYRSEYYDRSAQTLRLSQIADDGRPFILSTPRLPSADGSRLQMSFDHELVDQLFASRRRGMSKGQFQGVLDLAHEGAGLLGSLFIDSPARPYQPFEGPGVRWRYFGHACILLESEGISILSDPVLSYTYETTLSRYTYEDLPEHIDYALITHNHSDHILFETLLQLRHKIGTVIVPRNSGGSLQDPSMRLMLQHTGFNNVVEIGEMDVIAGPWGSITGLPFLGEHADLDIRSKLAYLIAIRGCTIMLAADSRNLEPFLYRRMRQVIGEIDVLFLGMECEGAPLSWLYGPLFCKGLPAKIDHSRRLAGCDYAQAADLLSQLGCREVYVYAMGLEPWLRHIMGKPRDEKSRPMVDSSHLLESCRNLGICAERLFGEKQLLMHKETLQ